MLGQRSPQGELFRPDPWYREHVGEATFYGWLATQGAAWFRDEDFAGLYREDFGRPSVPPSQLCLALLLQAHDRVSDAEAIDRSAYDLRWKVALGLELEAKLCAKSTLQMFRAKRVLHEAYGRVFEREPWRRVGTRVGRSAWWCPSTAWGAILGRASKGRWSWTGRRRRPSAPC